VIYRKNKGFRNQELISAPIVHNWHNYKRVLLLIELSNSLLTARKAEMSKKIDEAFYKLQSEAQHHIKLSQARQDEYENGFAQGMSEALRIVAAIRESNE
jgi:hypothetical protein